MGKQPQIVEIKMAAVEAMVERAKGLLAKEDHDLLKGLVDTLLTLVGAGAERPYDDRTPAPIGRHGEHREDDRGVGKTERG